MRVSFLLFLCAALLATSAGAQVNLNVYADVDYRLDKAEGVKGQSAFSAPRLDLLFSGGSGRVSFLAETVLEVGLENSFGVDVERIEVGYLFGPWLRVRAGRFHTALGYYNDAFHHGMFFQLPVERPTAVNFEDSGGLIPAHSIGLHFDGRFMLGAAGSIRYDVDVANGRGRTLDDVQNRFDVNANKAVNFRVRYEPAFLDGLILGVNLYVDQMPGDDTHGIPKMNEKIFGAHAAYQEGRVRFVAEAMLFQHDEVATSASYQTLAGFVEAGYAFGDFVPYALVERMSFPSTMDPFFAASDTGALGSRTGARLGLKWNLADSLALKAEVAHLFRDNGADLNSLATQVAFAF